jgi:hypothetical protein
MPTFFDWLQTIVVIGLLASAAYLFMTDQLGVETLATMVPP